GSIRDGIDTWAHSGALGEALNKAAAGYQFVYHIEIGLLFGTLIALGPLVRIRPAQTKPSGTPGGDTGKFGLAEFPT
ncbi:MAG: MFS transporter, partial [Pseudomonadota bacterium]